MKTAKMSILAACVFAGLSAFATAPSNDNKSGAIALPGEEGSRPDDSNNGASSAAGDWAYEHFNPYGYVPLTVWYKWTAPRKGMVVFDTIGSTFDTWIAVGTDSDGLIDYNDDGEDDEGNGLGDGVSRMKLSVTAGKTYYVLVSGYREDYGKISLNWWMKPLPSNDLKSNATEIFGEIGDATGTNVGASSESGDYAYDYYNASFPCVPASVWFKWTAPRTGEVSFDTIGSDFDTFLAVEGGGMAVSNDDGYDDDGNYLPNGASRIKVNVAGGTTYYIVLSGYSEEAGDFCFNWRMTAANGEMANATEIFGVAGAVLGSNVGMTSAAGDWMYDYQNDEFGACVPATVWYKWTAPKTGIVAFNTVGSDIDTVLVVGTQADGILASNDDGEDEYGNYLPDGASLVRLYVEEGTTLFLALSGYKNETGIYSLSWAMPDSSWGPWDVDANGTLLGYLGRKTDVSKAVVPDGVKVIAEDAFEDWGDLEEVTLPSSVTKICKYAFWGCHDLATVVLREGLVEIEDYAFWKSGLQWLRLPRTVTKITNKAFVGVNDDAITVMAPPSLRGVLSSEEMPYVKSVWDPSLNVLTLVDATTRLTVLFGIHSPTTEPVPSAAASQYDGYLTDASGKVAGTFTLKLGKPNKKTNLSKATANVQVGSGKKARYVGTYNAATGQLNVPGLAATAFDLNGITGTVGAYSVDGVRNVFAAKDPASKAAAAAALAGRKGAYAVAWQDGGPWGGLSVSVAAKGKTKTSGVLASGAKVTTLSGQLLVGAGGVAVVPVISNKKGSALAFNLWLNGDDLVPDGLGAECVAAKVGALGAGLSARCGLLSGDVPVTVAGKKWTVTTAKEVGMKLTFTPKTGVFKGSFKQGRTKVNVNGVVVGGRGYGNASSKKTGAAAFLIK